jgi:hypothetical protein
MKADNQGTEYKYDYKFREGEGWISLEGFETLHVSLNLENLANGLFERLKQKEKFMTIGEEQRQRLFTQARELLVEQGIDITNEQTSQLEGQAVRKLELKLIKDSIETARKMMSEKFPKLVIAFWEKLINIASFDGANALRDLLELPEQKYSAKVIQTELHKLEREKLKALMGTPTRGGAHNIKHVWTDDQRACLASKYEELQPIWIEAKRIAKAAQKSKERTRKQEWRKEVLRAYPDLPIDLLESFSTPRGGTKPSDLAVIHASRACGITAELSPRHLREEIKMWKLKTSN